MNPRYKKYLELGGDETKLYEYIIWINQQWRQWETETDNMKPHDIKHHAMFDKWLQSKTEIINGKNI